jgi:AraC family transcriptional regulator
MSELRANVLDARLRPGQFYGNVINKDNCSGLILSELSHKTHRKLPEHSHQLANFCLLIKGNYVEYFGGQVYEYKPMTIMFHPPELTHRDEIGNRGGHFFNIELDEDWMKCLREYSVVPDRPVGHESADLPWLAIRLYREFKAEHAHSRLSIEGLVMTMLGELTRTSVKEEKGPPRWLIQAVDLLHEEFDRNMTIHRVAAEVGVHPFHLSRVFKQFHRQTIGDYVKGLKVKFACQKLFDPQTELALVAAAAGFADQSHFTRVFKQVTGMTPGAFRAAILR